jgi:hypothetical protein
MASSAISDTYRAIRRKVKPASDSMTSSMTGQNIRMSGTTEDVLESIEPNPQDGQLGPVNGRTGNDWFYPDNPRGVGQIDTVNGDRMQDMTSRHLHEGQAPGRIPRMWQNRISGKLGRGITGNPGGDVGFTMNLSGDSAGGTGDQMFVPHTPLPRNSIVARPFKRTVDDAVNIPAVYVSDGSRR